MRFVKIGLGFLFEVIFYNTINLVKSCAWRFVKIAVHTGGLVKFLLEWIKKRRTGEVRFLAPPQRIFK